MIKSRIGHLVYHIEPQNLPFYKEMMDFLGWSVIVDEPGVLGLWDGETPGSSIWFGNKLKEYVNDYDGQGLNHLGLSVGSVADVDKAVDWLKARNVPALFDTPRHRPDFSSPGNTYYQVMFESPDRILFEIVYTGPMPAA